MSKSEPKATYTCQQCGLAVFVNGEQVVRPCGHTGAIAATTTATLYGRNKMSVK
jgi:hypothetical protein